MDISNLESGVYFARVRVTLIEHDDALAQVLTAALERSGVQVTHATTGAQGIALSRIHRPEIVLIAADLPDVNGSDLISWFEDLKCGVIMLTHAGEEAERILALELGADDVVQKPPPVRELVARIRSVHRRIAPRDTIRPAMQAQDLLVIGPICINLTLRSVSTLDNRRIPLTAAEYTALEAMAACSGQIVSRDVLSESALRRPWRPDNRSVDQLVFGLRQKLPLDEDGSALIQTVRGGGYRLRSPDMGAPSHQSPATEDHAWRHATSPA